MGEADEGPALSRRAATQSMCGRRFVYATAPVRRHHHGPHYAVRSPLDIGRERARPWHDEWPAALVPGSLNPVGCGIPFVVEIGCGCGPRSSYAKARTNREEVERQMLNLLETVVKEATR